MPVADVELVIGELMLLFPEADIEPLGKAEDKAVQTLEGMAVGAA